MSLTPEELETLRSWYGAEVAALRGVREGMRRAIELHGPPALLTGVTRIMEERLAKTEALAKKLGLLIEERGKDG